MKNKRLLEYIPEYPKGVSEEYLAIRTGYIRPPYKAKAVKKGLKKGTYKVKVNVKAAGNADYKAKTAPVTFTVTVK